MLDLLLDVVMLMRLMGLIEVGWEREEKEGQRKRRLTEREGVCRS